jgi:REP element-mobilizing transposase RayT
MSRLRRLVLSDCFFFLTVKLLPRRRSRDEVQFALLAQCLSVVRARKRFLLTAWVFLPDHWHAILFPPFSLTVSASMKSVKLSSSNLLGRFRDQAGEL